MGYRHQDEIIFSDLRRVEKFLCEWIDLDFFVQDNVCSLFWSQWLTQEITLKLQLHFECF
jgi:hypothetical protein